MSIIDETGPPFGGDWEETPGQRVGKGAEGFDISPDGRQLWAANAGDGSVLVIDLASKQVTATIPAAVNTANRLKFTPDGKLVFVSLLNGPEIVVVDAASHAVVKRIPSGRRAAGIQIDPTAAGAYVSCTPDNYVAVIDLKSLTSSIASTPANNPTASPGQNSEPESTQPVSRSPSHNALAALCAAAFFEAPSAVNTSSLPTRASTVKTRACPGPLSFTSV